MDVSGWSPRDVISYFSDPLNWLNKSYVMFHVAAAFWYQYESSKKSNESERNA